MSELPIDGSTIDGESYTSYERVLGGPHEWVLWWSVASASRRQSLLAAVGACCAGEGHVWPWNSTSPRRRAFHSILLSPLLLSPSTSPELALLTALRFWLWNIACYDVLPLTTRSNSTTLISFLSKNYPNNVNFIYRKKFDDIANFRISILPSYRSFLFLLSLFFLHKIQWIFRVFFEWTVYINVFFPLSRDSWEIRSEFSLFFNVYTMTLRKARSIGENSKELSTCKYKILVNYFLRFSKRRRSKKILCMINGTM